MHCVFLTYETSNLSLLLLTCGLLNANLAFTALLGDWHSPFVDRRVVGYLVVVVGHHELCLTHFDFTVPIVPITLWRSKGEFIDSGNLGSDIFGRSFVREAVLRTKYTGANRTAFPYTIWREFCPGSRSPDKTLGRPP